MSKSPINPSEFMDQVWRRAARSRRGYRSFAATVDLLGVRRMLRDDPAEAMSRLEDLQQSVAEATQFFPGDGQERACFAGDSWFIVRELAPEENEDELWKAFCGRLFALSSIPAELEHGLGNPGVRAIAARGALVQIPDLDEWQHEAIAHQTRNWFVLTGASEALRKCLAAEAAGRKLGFEWGHFWNEVPGNEFEFLGTPIAKIALEAYGHDTIYPTIYAEMCQRGTARARLPADALDK